MVVLLVVFGILVIVAVRSAAQRAVDPGRYVQAHGLAGDAMTWRLVSNHLERSAWYRRTGAWLAFAIVVVLSVLRLRTTPIPPLPEVLAGSLIGMALAESYRLRDLPEGERMASMDPRSVYDYRSRAAHAEPAFWACVLVVAGVIAAGLTHRHHVRGTGLIIASMLLGAAAFVFERVLSERIVQRGRPLLAEVLTRADDHLRATALESLRLATNGFLICAVLTVGVTAAPVLLPTEVRAQGETLVRIYDAKEIRQSPIGIEWTDRSEHVHVITFASLGAAGGETIRHGMQGRWAFVWWVVAVVLSVWAWGCWRQASRAAYDRSVRPLRRVVVA